MINALKEKKGVDTSNNNIRQDSPKKVKVTDVLQFSATLSTEEEARYNKIFTILGKTLGIGKFGGPEAERLSALQVKKAVPHAAAIVKQPQKEEDGLIKKLIKALALGGIIGTLASAFFDALGPFGRFFAKLPSKLKGAWSAIKLLSRGITAVFEFFKLDKAFAKVFTTAVDIFKESKLLKPVAEFLESIGSVISSGFGVFKNVFKGAKSLFKGEGILSKLLDGVVKTIGGKIGKFLKFLPFIGGIVGLGFAWTRFKEGDTVGAVFELISAILDLTGIGSVASVVIDGGLLLYDLYKGDKQGENKEVKGESKGFLTTIGNKIKDSLSTVLPYIPVIGGLHYFGQAVGAFKDGSVLDGLKLLAKGVITTIGGQGLVDGIMWVCSLLGGENTITEPQIEDASATYTSYMQNIFKDVGSVVGDSIKKIWDWSVGKVKDTYDKIRNFFGSSDAYPPGTPVPTYYDTPKGSGQIIEPDSTRKLNNIQFDNLQISNKLVEIGSKQVELLTIIARNISMVGNGASKPAVNILPPTQDNFSTYGLRDAYKEFSLT